MAAKVPYKKSTCAYIVSSRSGAACSMPWAATYCTPSLQFTRHHILQMGVVTWWSSAWFLLCAGVGRHPGHTADHGWRCVHVRR